MHRGWVEPAVAFDQFHGDEVAIARDGAPEQAKRLGALLDAASAARFGSWQRARN